MKLIELDRRHTGYGIWKWYVVPPRDYLTQDISKFKFFEYREWCWSEWGPSKELDQYGYRDLFDGVISSSKHWCWSIISKQGPYLIYLKGDLEANLFALRWA